MVPFLFSCNAQDHVLCLCITLGRDLFCFQVSMRTVICFWGYLCMALDRVSFLYGRVSRWDVICFALFAHRVGPRFLFMFSCIAADRDFRFVCLCIALDRDPILCVRVSRWAVIWFVLFV